MAGWPPADEAMDWLKRVLIVPVFTAHPTEVARRSVMFKRRRISDLLEQVDRIPVPEAQLESLQQDIIAEITALWQTDDVRSARPTVRSSPTSRPIASASSAKRRAATQSVAIVPM